MKPYRVFVQIPEDVLTPSPLSDVDIARIKSAEVFLDEMVPVLRDMSLFLLKYGEENNWDFTGIDSAGLANAKIVAASVELRQDELRDVIKPKECG